MRSNEGENVLTPFMGVGSEVYSSVANGRRGIGAELKASYYRQAVVNIERAAIDRGKSIIQDDLFKVAG
jgi:tRNA G10  N-methylase Trm11